MTEAPLWHARAYEMARDSFSLKQIAHECGVSKTTVARLLYPAYRRQQAEGRRRRRAERLANDPAYLRRERERINDGRARSRANRRKETPDGP